MSPTPSSMEPTPSCFPRRRHSGNYPAEAVMYMNRLAVVAESGFPFEKFLAMIPQKDISESVAHASCVLANHLGAKAIVAHTQTGRTARHISRFRPRQPIVALSPNEKRLGASA